MLAAFCACMHTSGRQGHLQGTIPCSCCLAALLVHALVLRIQRALQDMPHLCTLPHETLPTWVSCGYLPYGQGVGTEWCYTNSPMRTWDAVLYHMYDRPGVTYSVRSGLFPQRTTCPRPAHMPAGQNLKIHAPGGATMHWGALSTRCQRT